MSKISTYFSYLPKRPIAMIAGVVLAVALTATAVAGFGPDRPTKVYNGPGTKGFDYVTFNSFTNVPDIGDERQFHVGKYGENNKFNPTLTQLRGGEEISMRVYIHNGADPSLNSSGAGVAKNVNVKVDLPQSNAKSAVSKATISASNAKPTAVWSTVDFAAENKGFFTLDFVEGSAKLVGPSGTKALSDSLITTGVNIGDIKGCFEYAMAIDYKVKVKAPNYSIKKQVAVPGQPWGEEAHRKVNEETSWLVTFENKGTVNLDGVKIVDDLPPYNSIVPGSVQLFDTNFPNGYTYGPDAVQANGRQLNINIGTYAPGGVAYIKFKTKIDSNIPNLNCNTYRFQNVAYATPNGFSPVNDGAHVVVKGDCNPNEEFIRCEMLNVSIIDKNTRTVEASADVKKSDGIKVTGYEFNWGDGNTDKVTNNNAKHSYAESGSYKIVATIRYEENGKANSVTCQSTVDFDKGTVTPEPPTPQPTPEQPTTLPNTGPGEILASLFGTGAFAGATHMWVNSRRALKAKLSA